MLAEMVGSLMPFLQKHGNELGAFDKLMDPNEKGESQLKSHEKVGHAKLGAQRSKGDQNKQQRDRQQWVGHINSSAKKNNNYFHYHFHYHRSQITPRFYSPAQRQTRVALGFRGNLFALAHLRCLSLDTAFCFFAALPSPPPSLPALTRTTTCGARPTNRARARGGFPTHAQPCFSLTCILRPAWHRPCNKTAPDTREQKEEAARRSPQLRSCCLQNAQTRSSATPPSASICGLIFAVALILGLDAFLAAHVADRIEVFVLAALPQVVTLKNGLDILKSTLSPRAASGPSYWYSGLLQVVLVVEVFVCEKKEHPHTPHGHTICASEQRQ